MRTQRTFANSSVRNVSTAVIFIPGAFESYFSLPREAAGRGVVLPGPTPGEDSDAPPLCPTSTVAGCPGTPHLTLRAASGGRKRSAAPAHLPELDVDLLDERLADRLVVL